MNSKEMMFFLSEKFPGKVQFESASEKRLYIRIQPENLREIFGYIVKEKNGRLSTATGLEVRDGIEVLYHISFNGSPLVTTLKVMTPKHIPELDSVQDILKGAYWIEREIHDFLGVVFKGHPKLKRLLKARTIPEDIYPLRKDFNQEEFLANKG